jgi:hypothetical protein
MAATCCSLTIAPPPFANANDGNRARGLRATKADF